MCNYEYHEIKEDFHRGTHYRFSLFSQKITLLEKKYDIKLITLISMYHLKPLVSLTGSLKIKTHMNKSTLHNVCAVHLGYAVHRVMCSRLGDIMSKPGGYHEYTGGIS